MQRVVIWDEVSPINGVPAERVLENRPDLVAAHGDIFLVVDAYDRVNEIQIGATIAVNYGMEPGMELQAIADAYMVKKQEEEEAAEVERMTNEELQEEVAVLSYDVMVCQAAMNGGVAAVAVELNEGEHSPKFNKIRMWYNRGFWTKEMVGMAVHLGHLTDNERVEIVGE
jgi:hypothetical protein